MAIGSKFEIITKDGSANIKITHFAQAKEPTKVDIKSVICVRCNLVHLLDADGHCEFCRRRLASPPKTTWELVKGLFVKDHGTAALPPSVISD